MIKLSARNQIKGGITQVTKGQTTGHVHVDIGQGVIVHASITDEAIDDLALQVGDEAFAVIKASDVMIGKQGALPPHRSRRPRRYGPARLGAGPEH